MKSVSEILKDAIYGRKVLPRKFFEPAKPPPRGKYWANLWEAYSPKMDRDIVLYSDLEYFTWMMIEADETIVTFCPQAVYAEWSFQGKSELSLIDFWVHKEDETEEYWEVKYDCDMSKIDSKPELKRQINIQERWCEKNGYIHRIRKDTHLLNEGVRLNNWSHILCSLAHSRHCEKKAEMTEILNNLLLDGEATLIEVTADIEKNDGFAAICKLLSLNLIFLSHPDQALTWDSKIQLTRRALQ